MCTLSACVRLAGYENRHSAPTPHCSSASDAWSDAELPQWCFFLLLPNLSLRFGKGSCPASQCDIRWQHLHPILRSGERWDCERTLTEFHKTKLFRVPQKTEKTSMRGSCHARQAIHWQKQPFLHFSIPLTLPGALEIAVHILLSFSVCISNLLPYGESSN